MRRRWRPQSVRVRLALWYAGSLAVLLGLYAGGVFAFVKQSLYMELDRRLHDDFELAEEMLEGRPGGEIRWRADGHEDEDADAQAWTDAWSLDGKLLYRSEPFQKAGADKLAPPSPEFAGYGRGILPGGQPLRFLTGRYSVNGTDLILRVARPEGGLRRELGELLFGLVFGLIVMVGIAAFGGYVLARRALAPVGAMADRARTITAERLGERLPVVNPDDELGHLAMVFNEAFARLERSFEQLRQFTADASHELRTPLTAIRSVGEVGLREPRDEKAYREIVGSMLEEADRLARLVEALLTLSRADAGQVKLHREPVDLSALAREVGSHLEVLAEEKRQAIQVESPGPVFVKVDRLVVRQALINLIDNAIKYSPNGASIRVRLGAKDHTATLEVVDQGTGIPEEHQPRVFERFYRVDKARSRELGGAGLGLSIARWAVEANGGRIELESKGGGEGSTFRIVLPLS